MNSEIKVFERENGQIQRVQKVTLDDWSQLDFLQLQHDTVEQQVKTLKCFRDIYQNYLVPACPWIFPQMAMFVWPEEDEMYDVLARCIKDKMHVEPPRDGEEEDHLYYVSERYGNVADPLTIVTILLQEGVKIKGGEPVFTNVAVSKIWKALEERNCVYIVRGKKPGTKIIPVGRSVGYLTETMPEAQLKVNANFFIMDPFDCATVYDQVGMPFGLCVKDGVVEQPPLFGREALLVEKEGAAYISKKDIRDILIEVNGKTFIPGKNATVYTRPEHAKTPEEKGTHLVIVGRNVVAVKRGGTVEVPAAGFVVVVKSGQFVPGDVVTYHGLKDVKFGIQVGNSIMRKGVKTEKFISRFYNIYHLERVAYPPCLLPMDFKKARAARMAIGSDTEGRPVIFWAEGKGKIKYMPGEDSTGASLTEMAEIAEALGLRNVVNLDGGGSAQILLENQRVLKIADRNKEDNSEAERLIPLGLVVR